MIAQDEYGLVDDRSHVIFVVLLRVLMPRLLGFQVSMRTQLHLRLCFRLRCLRLS